MKVEYNERTDPRIQVVCQHGAGSIKPKLDRQDDLHIPKVAQYGQKGSELVQQVYATSLEIMSPSHLMEIHWHSEHPRVQHAIYVSTVCPVSKAMVNLAIGTSGECTTIDLAPIYCQMGRLWVNSTWYWLGMDIMNYSDSYYLTLTDQSLLHFSVWQSSHHQDLLSIKGL